jgi:hypothetical protein
MCRQVAIKHVFLIFAFPLLVSVVLGFVQLWRWFLGLVITCVDLSVAFKAVYRELPCSEAGSWLVRCVDSGHDLVNFN